MKKNNNDNLSIEDNIPSIIAPDLRVVGNLICGGTLVVEGEVEGNIDCHNLSVRKTGVINGDISADEITIDGKINGTLKAKSIIISETGKVTGTIIYETLSVKDGAFIDGQCKSTYIQEDQEEEINSHFEEERDLEIA